MVGEDAEDRESDRAPGRPSGVTNLLGAQTAIPEREKPWPGAEAGRKRVDHHTAGVLERLQLVGLGGRGDEVLEVAPVAQCQRHHDRVLIGEVAVHGPNRNPRCLRDPRGRECACSFACQQLVGGVEHAEQPCAAPRLRGDVA